MTYLGTSSVGVVVVWMVLWVLALLLMPTVRVWQVILGGWCVSWWSDGVGVVGVGAGRGLRLGGWRYRAWGLATPGRGPGGRLLVGWLAVLVVLVVSGDGVAPSAVFGSVVVGVAPVVVEGVDAVGGLWYCCDAAVGGVGDVLGGGAASRAPGVDAASDADGEGVVGDALVDNGVLTVPWGWNLATPGGGSHGRCWPVNWSWRYLPCLVSGPSSVSFMPMVLHALYQVVPGARAPWVVLPRWLLLMLRVAVSEVALLLVLLLMPVARPLRALLPFYVGPCLGGQWLVFGVGLPLFPGGSIASDREGVE